LSTSKDTPSNTSQPPMESMTKTVESGAFIRTVWRKGKKRRQESLRIKPNYKKVILGGFGEFEVYVYPFDYPDKVFIGKFPVSTYLVMSDVKKLMGLTATMRWFLDGKAFNEDGWRKGVNSRRRAIQNSYNLALSELRSKEKTRIKHNYNYTTGKGAKKT